MTCLAKPDGTTGPLHAWRDLWPLGQSCAPAEGARSTAAFATRRCRAGSPVPPSGRGHGRQCCRGPPPSRSCPLDFETVAAVRSFAAAGCRHRRCPPAAPRLTAALRPPPALPPARVQTRDSTIWPYLACSGEPCTAAAITSAGVGAIGDCGARSLVQATGVGAPSGSITVMTASPIPNVVSTSSRS